MRQPFKKSLGNIPLEQAHGGNGKRQLILSQDDLISSNLEAMTKGFLPVGNIFDWHSHEGVDEFFLVLEGVGIIKFEHEGQIEYSPNDLIYIPRGVKHRIEAQGKNENKFFFIRIKD